MSVPSEGGRASEPHVDAVRGSGPEGDATVGVGAWVREMDDLLARWCPTPGCEVAFERLTESFPAGGDAAGGVDAVALGRVLDELRRRREEIARDLCEVRTQRQELARAGAGHAAYAATLNASGAVPIRG